MSLNHLVDKWFQYYVYVLHKLSEFLIRKCNKVIEWRKWEINERIIKSIENNIIIINKVIIIRIDIRGIAKLLPRFNSWFRI